MAKKRDRKNEGDKPRVEQGALGDLLSKSAASTPITDSREVLNPAARAARTPTSPSTPIPPQPSVAPPVVPDATPLAASRPPVAETPKPTPPAAAPITIVPLPPPPTSISASAHEDEAVPVVPAPPVIAPVIAAVPVVKADVPAASATPASSAKPASGFVPLATPPVRPVSAKPAGGPAAPVDIIAEIRGRGPSRFKKLPGESSRRVLVTVALVVSLLVHIAVGVVMGHHTAGKLAIALEDTSIVETFRVTAPPIEDPIYSDPLLSSDAPVAQPSKQPGLGEISKLLLLNKTAGDPTNAAVDTSPTPQPAKVEHPDVQPAIAKVDLAGTANIDLPSDLGTKLTSGANVELPIVTGVGTTPAAAPTTTANAGPTTAAQAKSLLKGMIGGPAATGPQGSGFSFGEGVTVPTPNQPAVADAAPKIDRRLLEAPAAAPPIEIAAIALQEARTLDIPEKLDDDFDYVVTKFRPEIGGGLFNPAKPDKYTYFKVDITAKRSLRKLKTMPKDVVFLIDTSGSVPQDWVNGVARGVRDALGTLNEGDRFNIVYFAEKTTLFSDEGIQPADAKTVARAQQFLTGARSAGDTDINRSLARLLQRDTAAQRAYYLVFVSDGIPTRGVMDTRELINLVTRDNDLNTSIYCIGVGSNQNRELLNFLSYRNKGWTTFSKQPEEAAGAIRDLMSRIRYPILKDVGMNVIGLDPGEVFPHNLPNIHQGETFSVFGRYEVAGVFSMRIGGHNGVKAMDVTFGGDLLAAKVGAKTIPEDWGFWKLHHIYSEIIRQGEKPELKRAIAELKERFDLKTLY